MKPSPWVASLFLTVGWLGIEMAMALDMGQFQLMLHDQVGQAFIVGLILSMGPLMGFTVQPLVGYYSDYLEERGLPRRKLIAGGLAGSLASLVWLAFLPDLTGFVLALVLFYVSFNIVMVCYRAYMTETTAEPPLKNRKGMVSGFSALFATVGTTGMFVVGSLAPGTSWPFLTGATLLIITFVLFFMFSPEPAPSARTRTIPPESLLSRWHLLFYVFPPLALWPGLETRIARQDYQRAIFRLFTVIFFAWLGLQSLRGYFTLYARENLDFEDAFSHQLMAMASVAVILSTLPIGRLADKLELSRLFRGFLIAFALVNLGAYFWVQTPWQAIIFTVLIGVCLAGTLVCPLAALLRLCPRDQEGAYSGLYNVFLSVPQFYSLLVTGWLLDQWGYGLVPLISALFLGLAFLAAFRLHVFDIRESDEQDHQATP